MKNPLPTVAYVVIRSSSVEVLGGFWTADYNYAQERAVELNGVVANHSYMIRKTGKDVTKDMGLVQAGPRRGAVGRPWEKKEGAPQ